MISEELKEFYDYCMTVENSYSRSWIVDDPNWTTHRICSFSNGVVFGLYRENNPMLLSLMEKQYDKNELYRLICKAVDHTNATGKKMFADYGRNPESAPVQNYPNKEQNLVEWYKSYNYCMIEPLLQEDENRVLSFLYIYYAYEEYCTDEKARLEIDQPHIHELYADETNDDFLKWNLVPVQDVNRILSAYTPPRIFDKQKSRTLIVDLPRPFVEVLVELQKCRKIGTLSVRCKDTEIFEGKYEIQILCEDVEQGRQFSLSITSLPNMTKLYDSKEYNNQLWINKTDTDMTFEELCDDFPVERDSIVTSMIHLSYVGNMISHIDYEKIFYTIDEYDHRKRKMDIRGTAYKRQKYFKINDSCIPFDFPCKVLRIFNDEDEEVQVPFIFFVLNCFFTHRDLIDEYFEKVLKL